MNTIKHVFFDLDNTLWDFRKNARFALDELYKKYDVENRYGFTFEEFHPFYHDSNEGLWALIRDKKITKEELRARRFKEAFDNLGLIMMLWLRFLKRNTWKPLLIIMKW